MRATVGSVTTAMMLRRPPPALESAGGSEPQEHCGDRKHSEHSDGDVDLASLSPEPPVLLYAVRCRPVSSCRLLRGELLRRKLLCGGLLRRGLFRDGLFRNG